VVGVRSVEVEGKIRMHLQRVKLARYMEELRRQH
jgi:hypothetical protein